MSPPADREPPTGSSAAAPDPPRYRRILVGTDGSTTATRAVDRAASVAASHGAALTILSAGRGADRVLDREVERLGDSGIDVTTVATRGDASRALREEAVHGGHDLLVVGNKGLHGVQRLNPLGSVPGRISHQAPCSLLVVKTT